MRTVILALAATMLMAGGAYAQDTKSDVDKGATSAPHGDAKPTSPGTTGAMNNSAGGVATSPQDTQMQQSGKSTATEGGAAIPGASTKDPNKSSKENQTGQ